MENTFTHTISPTCDFKIVQCCVTFNEHLLLDFLFQCLFWMERSLIELFISNGIWLELLFCNTLIMDSTIYFFLFLTQHSAIYWTCSLVNLWISHSRIRMRLLSISIKKFSTKYRFDFVRMIFGSIICHTFNMFLFTIVHRTSIVSLFFFHMSFFLFVFL